MLCLITDVEKEEEKKQEREREEKNKKKGGKSNDKKKTGKYKSEVLSPCWFKTEQIICSTTFLRRLDFTEQSQNRPIYLLCE